MSVERRMVGSKVKRGRLFVVEAYTRSRAVLRRLPPVIAFSSAIRTHIENLHLDT